jgi:hypothetical protein
MKWFRHIALAALALVSVLGVANQADAQGVQGSKAVPSAIQRQWIANERIYMEVFVDNTQRPGNNPEAPRSSVSHGEHYGNRLGDVIPMRIRIFCIMPNKDAGAAVVAPAPSATGNTPLPVIKLDFAALKQGRLTIDQDPDNDPDWVFAKKESLGANESPLEMPEVPTVVTIVTPDGQKRDAELWDLRLFVQTKRRPEPMLFWMEFNYCAELNANGQKEFKRADTPDFIVSGSYTGDKGRDLEIGDTGVVDVERPLNLALLLAGVGATMILLPLGLIIVRAAQRALAKPASQAVTPAQVWAVIDPILEAPGVKTEAGYCLDPDDVLKIVVTFKQYIGFNGTASQFKGMIGEFDNGELIYKVLDNLQYRVLEQEQISDARKAAGHSSPGLSDKRYGQLIAVIEQLIPRP